MARDRVINCWHGWIRPDVPGAPWRHVVTGRTQAEASARLRDAVPGRGYWTTVRPRGETPR
jgi:hypothetical protein